MKTDGKIKWFVILHVIILLFSVNSICAKLASQYGFLKPMWIFYYGLVICILGFYAIAWQQVLKHLPLITTYANKAVTTIWGLIWGYFIFKETITIQKVIGASVVIAGVYLVVSGDEEVNGKKSEEEAKDNA